MAKIEKIFICSNCWEKYSKWKSMCSNCEEFWTIEEQNEIKKESVKIDSESIKKFSLEEKRYSLNNEELNKLFGWNEENGYGIYEWSALIFTWEPGNWKSTLFLQISNQLIKKYKDIKISYFSWEENENQIYSRAKRLWLEDMISWNFFMKFTWNLEEIKEMIDKDKPNLIFIDSVQTLYSNEINWSAWNKTQIEYCTEELVTHCKRNHITLICSWQVVKSWVIAWPKTLEHLLDATIYIKKEEFNWKELRFFKSEKNRFWPTDVVVTAEMTEKWLEIITQKEATNIFMEEANIQDSDYWYIFSMIFEWRSPFLVEVQCMTSQVISWFPFRRSIWYDLDRLNWVLMVLEKFWEVLSWTNVAINVSWKSSYKDSEWLDLAVALAIISAKYKKSLWKSIAYWEIWFRWEIKWAKYSQIIEKQSKESWFEKEFNSKKFNHLSKLLNELNFEWNH